MVFAMITGSTGQTNCSGHADGDYPCLDNSISALANLPLINLDIHHVPLPPELIEEFHSILIGILILGVSLISMHASSIKLIINPSRPINVNGY